MALFGLFEFCTRSGAFPAARRSPLQIYRILANDHYDHLRELLESLNFCARAGYLPPKLGKRRDRARFDSDLAEAMLAEHLLRNEVGVQDLDALRGSELTPEFIAHANDLDLAVEVYAPRTRLGLDLLMDELKDPVKNLDEPIRYQSRPALAGRLRAETTVAPPNHPGTRTRRRYPPGDSRAPNAEPDGAAPDQSGIGRGEPGDR